MREICTSGSEGGGAVTRSPYLYQNLAAQRRLMATSARARLGLRRRSLRSRRFESGWQCGRRVPEF